MDGVNAPFSSGGASAGRVGAEQRIETKRIPLTWFRHASLLNRRSLSVRAERLLISLVQEEMQV